MHNYDVVRGPEASGCIVMGGTPLRRLDCIRPLRRCIRPRAQLVVGAQGDATAELRVLALSVPPAARAARRVVGSRAWFRVRVQVFGRSRHASRSAVLRTFSVFTERVFLALGA